MIAPEPTTERAQGSTAVPNEKDERAKVWRKLRRRIERERHSSPALPLYDGDDAS